MIGTFFVYESHVDDIISDYQHDPMWGGHSYPYTQARTSFSAEVKEEEDEGVVVDVTGPAGGFAHGDLFSPEPQLQVQQLQQMPAAVQSPPAIVTLHTHAPPSPQPVNQQVSQQPSATPGRPHKNKATAGDGPKSRSKFYARKKSATQKHGQPTPDTKKLRHREVEKNRHRLLQAMVKTLSERIPGRLDKETQVQTMKRAARYCVFLREIANEMSRVGDPVSESALKGKLDKIYHLARDNVELVMSKK